MAVGHVLEGRRYLAGRRRRRLRRRRRGIVLIVAGIFPFGGPFRHELRLRGIAFRPADIRPGAVAYSVRRLDPHLILDGFDLRDRVRPVGRRDRNLVPAAAARLLPLKLVARDGASDNDGFIPGGRDFIGLGFQVVQPGRRRNTPQRDGHRVGDDGVSGAVDFLSFHGAAGKASAVPCGRHVRRVGADVVGHSRFQVLDPAPEYRPNKECVLVPCARGRSISRLGHLPGIVVRRVPVLPGFLYLEEHGVAFAGVPPAFGG